MVFKKQHGFGIIGTGSIAHTHAKAIAEIGTAELVGVYNQTRDKAEKFAKDYHCHVFDSLENMLTIEDIDIVCICTPSGAHLESALASIQAGKHCLIEKPLEITVGRCEKIIHAAQEKGVKVSVIFPSRFYDASKKIKEAIDQKRFGKLVLGDAYVKWHRSKEYYQSGEWRGTWKLDGGGALMNQGIHAVDLLQWYMGDVLSVQAYAANVQHKSIEVEDTIVATLQFANGALGTIECSTATFPGSPKRIEIRGTTGSVVMEEQDLIQWDFQDEDNSIREAKKSKKIETGGFANPTDISFKGHQMQIKNMIKAVSTGDEPLISAEEGMKSVEIIEAVYESAKTGERVAV